MGGPCAFSRRRASAGRGIIACGDAGEHERPTYALWSSPQMSNAENPAAGRLGHVGM